jgi:hypothetical protein
MLEQEVFLRPLDWVLTNFLLESWLVRNGGQCGPLRTLRGGMQTLWLRGYVIV